MTAEFQPTDAQRVQVRSLAGYGVPQEAICSIVGVRDPKTLRKHFREELDLGDAQAKMALGRSLFDLAVGRPAQFDDKGRQIREELKPDKSAAIFAAKARLGFREVQRVEHSGPNGGPIVTTELDLSVLDDEELGLFMTLYRKAKRAADERAAADVAG